MKKKTNFSKLLDRLKEGDNISIAFKHEGKIINEKSLRSLASQNKCSVSKDWDEEVFIVTKAK